MTGGEYGDKMVTFGFVRRMSLQYDMMISMDIRNLIVKFYDTEILHIIASTAEKSEHYNIEVSSVVSC